MGIRCQRLPVPVHVVGGADFIAVAVHMEYHAPLTVIAEGLAVALLVGDLADLSLTVVAVFLGGTPRLPLLAVLVSSSLPCAPYVYRISCPSASLENASLPSGRY